LPQSERPCSYGSGIIPCRGPPASAGTVVC
jgi:hypothetical protein